MKSYLSQILDLEDAPWDKYKNFDGKYVQYVCNIRFLSADLLEKIRYK
jgi:hypothetical protein